MTDRQTDGRRGDHVSDRDTATWSTAAGYSSNTSGLQQRAAALEQERAEYARRKQQLETEFNQKRAKFKELYLSKEEELKRQGASLDSAQAELSQVKARLKEAQAEMENIKAVATVSESTKQEAIDQVKRQWQEEVASLQAIMKDTLREYEVQFHQRLEQERAQWNQYREAVEREMTDLRRRLSEGQEEENLENEMKKAQEDAEKLRSVVMPMEHEIADLKAKLVEAEERVKELEASKVTELNHVLEAEKSCRTDLEMYVAVLNTQKAVLQEDAEKLRKELHEVCHLLELERQQHNQLKHTWQRANDQFLESQRLLMRDMQRIESVLSSEQLRQVEEMKRRDQEEDEKQRLSQAKELKEEEECTDPGEDSLHGLPTDEVKNAGRKLGRRCDMCSNYEKQLQVIQGQEADTRDQVKKLQAMLRQANDQLERTMAEKQELQDSLKQSSEETATKVSTLMQKVQETETLLVTLQQAFSQAKRSTQEQMAVLMQSREQVADELSRLQRDNESLQGKHRMHLSLQQQEDFQLPTSVQELQALVLSYREDIVAARTAADHLEEKLKAEILFLKEQIQAEQCLKDNLEDTLQLEIEGYKEEIASFSSLKTELERVKVEKEQLERTLEEKSQALDGIQGLKSSLEGQLKEALSSKTALESQVFDEKDKAQRLQTELDVSEQVQRDFVKLSQTLQPGPEVMPFADGTNRHGTHLTTHPQSRSSWNASGKLTPWSGSAASSMTPT
ncbi:rab GTPase-binding effector protein 1 isoform X4 [Brienomyrus brachyistius]|uniref:rab GTPase-binding effector protein 1 isoform X4 n=1 Tax=Brienomyrus brachyistius TaxID=42636 RepID=UPI0020B351F8|nr:rab GTPase-binding effector protein 1 isoform X4 [Brienomyrus brachyistius]